MDACILATNKLNDHLDAISGIPETTNMVYLKLNDEAAVSPQALVDQMAETYQINLEPGSYGEFRLVTHYWVTAEDVETTLAAFQAILDK